MERSIGRLLTSLPKVPVENRLLLLDAARRLDIIGGKNILPLGRNIYAHNGEGGI
jgi:hypothetical protein